MARQTIKQFVEGLYCDNVQAEVRQVDWSEILGEDCEGFRAYETDTCSECGAVVCNGGSLGESQHRDLDHNSECGGYLNFDGPMMNYFYPCDFSRVGGAEEAAKLISGAVCAVEMRDGETGFALTGGGMDLSWDICGAYVACGQLPPADRRLPRFAGAGLSTRARRIIAACLRSQEVAMNYARNNIADLKNTRRYLWGNTKANRQRKQEASTPNHAH